MSCRHRAILRPFTLAAMLAIIWSVSQPLVLGPLVVVEDLGVLEALVLERGGDEAEPAAERLGAGAAEEGPGLQVQLHLARS